MKLRLLYLDLWLQRNQWRLFVAIGALAIAGGVYAKWDDKPARYNVAITARG